MASDLLQKVLQAHGGLDQWNSFETLEATIVTGGQLLGMKGTLQIIIWPPGRKNYRAWSKS